MGCCRQCIAIMVSQQKWRTGSEVKKTQSEPCWSFRNKQWTSCVTAVFTFLHIFCIFDEFTLDAAADEEVVITPFNILLAPSSFISLSVRPPYSRLCSLNRFRNFDCFSEFLIGCVLWSVLLVLLKLGNWFYCDQKNRHNRLHPWQITSEMLIAVSPEVNVGGKDMQHMMC